jgi:Sushi repeat (SCR repeat)
VCGPPAIPANSRVTTKTTDYGIGEAKYECDTGYELFGQDTVRCDAKKGWDKEMPFCGEFCPFDHHHEVVSFLLARV